MPSGMKLVAGDVILRVDDQPVNCERDCAFHWDRAATGPVRFLVQRTETHRLSLNAAALRALELTWSTAECHAPLPVVASSNASEAWLRAVQTPAVPQYGDLIIAIGGQGCASAADAAQLFDAARRRATDDAAYVTEVSLARGWKEPYEGKPGKDWCGLSNCCPRLSQVTPIPKARRAGAQSSSSSTSMGETLLQVPEAREQAVATRDVEIDA